MNEGRILLEYINQQKKPKQKIADELGMSRSNLYQIFASQSLAEETRKKFEDYFNDKIFIDNAKENFEKIVQAVYNQPVQDENKYIQSLEREIKLLEKINESLEKRLQVIEANLNEVLSNQKVLMSMMAVAMNNVVDFYAAGNKSKADTLKSKMRTEIAAATK